MAYVFWAAGVEAEGYFMRKYVTELFTLNSFPRVQQSAGSDLKPRLLVEIVINFWLVGPIA